MADTVARGTSSWRATNFVIAGACFSICALLAGESVADHNVVGALPPLAVFLLLALVSLRRAFSAVVIEADACVVRNPPSTHRINWSDVKAVEIGRMNGTMKIVRGDGRAVKVTCLTGKRSDIRKNQDHWMTVIKERAGLAE